MRFSAGAERFGESEPAQNVQKVITGAVRAYETGDFYLPERPSALNLLHALLAASHRDRPARRSRCGGGQAP